MKNQPGTMKNHEKPWKTMKNQPGTMKNHEKPWKTRGGGAGQEQTKTSLTRGHNWPGEGVQGRNKQKRDWRGVTNDLGGGQGRNKQKRDWRGVTTDLLDV